MKNKKRGYLQISFAWLFAIIAGAVILFLAIYASTRIISTEQTAMDARTGEQIGVLLNPLETSFETAKVTLFTMPVDTRIYNKCDSYTSFGEQIIQVSQKSFNKWTETNIDVSFENKYIFSEMEIEGKEFYVFSKPFEFPFKVADLIYMTSSRKAYCFLDPPEEIEEEIEYLGQGNILLEEDENCEDAIQVCFKSGDCDIYVYSNTVEKDGKVFSYDGDALMYAAIFSDKDIYDCQVERLMKRTKQLATIYRDKAEFISREGCYSNLNLQGLINAGSFNSMALIAEEIKEANDDASCKLW